jgi:hypothetical protein
VRSARAIDARYTWAMRATLLTLLTVAALSVGLTAQAPAPAPPKADITGKWTASFETQIGVQNYTYEFVVKAGVLTGTLTSANGASKMTPGKVEGDKVTFGETLVFMEMEIPIAYTGKIVSADEIAFTRVVGEFATEELVAKRVK